jgi:hypothetical protein
VVATHFSEMVTLPSVIETVVGAAWIATYAGSDAVLDAVLVDVWVGVLGLLGLLSVAGGPPGPPSGTVTVTGAVSSAGQGSERDVGAGGDGRVGPA